MTLIATLQSNGTVRVTRSLPGSDGCSTAALVFSKAEWVAFIAGVKDGEFDTAARPVDQMGAAS